MIKVEITAQDEGSEPPAESMQAASETLWRAIMSYCETVGGVKEIKIHGEASRDRLITVETSQWLPPPKDAA